MIVLMGSDVSVEYMPLLPTAKYWVVTIPRTGMTALIHESVKCEWPCSSMLYGADSVVPRPVPSSSPITHTHTLRGFNAFHALVNHIPNSAHLCCIPYMYYQYYSLPKVIFTWKHLGVPVHTHHQRPVTPSALLLILVFTTLVRGNAVKNPLMTWWVLGVLLC